MANQTLLNLIQSQTDPNSWESRCISAINSSSFDWTNGLVNGGGHPVPGLSNATWGITFATCMEYCNHHVIPFVSDTQRVN